MKILLTDLSSSIISSYAMYLLRLLSRSSTIPRCCNGILTACIAKCLKYSLVFRDKTYSENIANTLRIFD